MTAPTFTALDDCLRHFQDTFNNNERVQKLIKNWDRSVIVEATDTEAVLTMTIRNLAMTEVKAGAHPEGDNPVHLQAAQDSLIRIFSGDYNPAHALIDGELAVFSSEKDKIKLEAITMVIWGM